MRALAQVVLDQRSEVEQFFLEALEQIKEEIRKKNTLEKKQKRQVTNPSAMGGGPDGSIQGGHAHQSSNASNDPAKAFSDKVDLNDLEWEDRERVLRLLFSKMNAGIQTNSLAARTAMRQAQGREQNMQAISNQQMQQMPDQAHYRQQYGNHAFNQYVEDESHRGEGNSEYQAYGDEQEEAPLAIEYHQ